MTRSWPTIGRVLLAAIALVAACTSPALGKSLRLPSAFDPQSMDPHALALLYQTRIASQIYESLVGRDRAWYWRPIPRGGAALARESAT